MIKRFFTKYTTPFEKDVIFFVRLNTVLFAVMLLFLLLGYVDLKTSNIYDGQDKINGMYNKLINDNTLDYSRIGAVIDACKIFKSYMTEPYKCDKIKEWYSSHPIPRYNIDNKFINRRIN